MFDLEFLILYHAQPRRSQLHRSSAWTRLHRFHRGLGAFFLLWDAGVACPLHGQPAATSRTHRAHRCLRSISPPDRDLSRSALSPGARLDHLRSLHRSRLSYTDCRRLHCRPLSWSNPHDHNRCTPHVGRAFPHGLRRNLSSRANLSAHRRRLFQGQPCQPGRRIISSRRQPARRCLPDLLLVHQRRSHCRPAHRRHARRKSGLALRFRRSRRRHAHRPDDLSRRPQISPARFAGRREKCECTETTPQQAGTDCHPCVTPAFAGINDRRHWQSTNLQRVFGVGTRPRQSRLFRLPTADDLADYPRFNLVRKLSRGRGRLLATMVKEISGASRDYQDQHR